MPECELYKKKDVRRCEKKLKEYIDEHVSFLGFIEKIPSVFLVHINRILKKDKQKNLQDWLTLQALVKEVISQLEEFDKALLNLKECSQCYTEIKKFKTRTLDNKLKDLNNEIPNTAVKLLMLVDHLKKYVGSLEEAYHLKLPERSQLEGSLAELK